MADLTKPKTITQTMLAAISGDYSGDLPEPQTVEQEYLAKIANNSGGGTSVTVDEKLTADGTNPVQGGAIKKYVDTGLQNLNSSISETTNKTGIFTSWTNVNQSSDPVGCLGNAYATKSGNLTSIYGNLTFTSVYDGHTPSITFFTLPEKFRPKFAGSSGERIIFPIYTDYADTSLERKNDSVMMLGEITEDGKVKTIDYPEGIELKQSQMFRFSTTFVSMGWGQET